MKEKHISKSTVTIEHEGKTYSALYWTEKRIVKVSSLELGQTSAHLGSMTPLALARLLLEEMIQRGKQGTHRLVSFNHRMISVFFKILFPSDWIEA